MTNLSLYALKDEKTGICSMFATAQNDTFAIQFYTSQLQLILNSMSKKKDESNRIQFINAVHNSKLVRLADIDICKPEVIQNLAFVADFNQLNIEYQEKNKNENKGE